MGQDFLFLIDILYESIKECNKLQLYYANSLIIVVNDSFYVVNK